MNWRGFVAWLDDLLEQIVHGDLHTEPATPLFLTPLPITKTTMPTETKAEKLYALSKHAVGIHLSLNDAVPWAVGCAEAVSKLLQEFGVMGIPARGIEGTAVLLDFLSKSAQFQEIYTYTPGAIILSATGSGNGKIRGHVGVCGNTAIMSNNSETGKWDTQWNIDRWEAYYGGYGAIPTRYFLPV